MVRYLVRAISNPAEKLSSPSGLSAWVADLAGKLGGCVETLDYTIGEADMVLLLEMPDDAATAAFSELASNAGKLRVAQVSPLIRPDQARAALQRTTAASDPSAGFRVTPPAPFSPPASVEVHEGAAAEEDPAPGLTEPGPAATLGTAAEVAPGAYELVAGRFTRFSELAGFSETIQALPGIKNVAIQQFLRGMVSLRIQYDSPIPLQTRLQELRQFKPVVRATGPAQIEMVIFAESRGAAAPGPAVYRASVTAAVQSPPPRASLAPPSGSLLHPALVAAAGQATAAQAEPAGSPSPWRLTRAASLIAGLVTGH